MLLTRNNQADFAALNPGSECGYRNVKASDIGGGIKAFICDFSITHGLFRIPVLYNLLTSKDPQQMRAVRKMIKNAVIIADMTGYPEYKMPY